MTCSLGSDAFPRRGGAGALSLGLAAVLGFEKNVTAFVGALMRMLAGLVAVAAKGAGESMESAKMSRVMSA